MNERTEGSTFNKSHTCASNYASNWHNSLCRLHIQFGAWQLWSMAIFFQLKEFYRYNVDTLLIIQWKPITHTQTHSIHQFYTAFSQTHVIIISVTTTTLISTAAAAALTRLASTPASFSLGHFVTTFWWHRLCTTHVHTTKQTGG